MNKNKMKTMAFSNLIGSIIFLAIGIWAWYHHSLPFYGVQQFCLNRFIQIQHVKL